MNAIFGLRSGQGHAQFLTAQHSIVCECIILRAGIKFARMPYNSTQLHSLSHYIQIEMKLIFLAIP